MTRLLYHTLVALAAVQYSLQQARDPVGDFCRRFGHQTTIIGQRLYIDGGEVVWNSDSPKTNQTNKWLLYNDLADIENGMPQLKDDLSKDATVPIVSGGILWSDAGNQTFYQFGGEFADSDQVEESSVWMYNITSDRWTSPDSPLPGVPERLAWGAGTTIQDRSEGYLFGGWQNNLTTPDWGSRAPEASSRMLKYLIDENRWTNSSGPDDIGRAEGTMLYLPASDAGLLVHFGGVLDSFQNGTITGANMSDIHIFDVLSQKWYLQTATGDVPESRGRFCAGVTWASDRSSYNIYMYGGLSPTGSSFDDVHVLSLPSFRWIKWWGAEPGEGHPHHSLSCNVVNNAQMIIIGGTFPYESDYCDAPTIWGTHNLKMGGGNDWIEWAPFNESLDEYQVPSNITAVIGGGPTGGATLTAPVSWSNQDLPVYFTLKITPSANPTAIPPTTFPFPNSSSAPSTATIVGASIGSAAALFIIIALIWYFRHRAHTRTTKTSSSNTTPPELPTYPARYTPAIPVHTYPYNTNNTTTITSPAADGNMYVMPSELDSPHHTHLDRKTTPFVDPGTHPAHLMSEHHLRPVERDVDGPGGMTPYSDELGSTLGGEGTMRSGSVPDATLTQTGGHGQWVWRSPGSPGRG
ncbi:hypothetical protein EJ05DRAFT_484605 [Pseudovirgaria hyperparasitica]|uniref:Galactose oxidase n=1 Tax=Pseudovirgaria hyperparasitica TaxID=470096 RepID=A0A6A6WCV3_9PEZI|nr:uncharacterized protein EJ05DRAFT_484605 [Pseudovirgaria hyperparasitica]KAF2759676.1 hypothetical protein EJ05DRAFT_484605 [Pseudovirgaria hyperparasitica]